MSSLTRSSFVTACVALAMAAGAARAEERPLWEAGLGVGAILFPDYRGADREQNYIVPVPYVVYRGDYLKADRDGVRGRFFRSERVDLNVGVSASAPVDSSDNPTRAGMPDLKPAIEIGPSLDVTLWRAPDRQSKLDFRLPVLWGMTVEKHPASIGFQLSPRLNLDVRDPAGLTGWNLGLAAGPIFANRKRHQHFYSVESQFATPGRPAYVASSGYGGTQFLAAMSKRYPSFWVGGFVRFDTLKNAVFEDSPLVKRDTYFAAGIGVSWIFAESSRRVEVTD